MANDVLTPLERMRLAQGPLPASREVSEADEDPSPSPQDAPGTAPRKKAPRSAYRTPKEERATIREREVAALEVIASSMWTDDEPPMMELGGLYVVPRDAELTSTPLLVLQNAHKDNSELRVARKAYVPNDARKGDVSLPVYAHLSKWFRGLRGKVYRTRGVAIEPHELRPIAACLISLADALGVPPLPKE